MEDKLENTIMGKIKTGQVKIKSKYIFVAEKLGLGAGFTLSVLLSVLFFNLILFYLKETDNLKYLSFGKFGILAFLESFPYLLVVSFIIFIGLAGYLITKSDVSYRKPFGYLAIGLVVFIMVFGTIFTFTNLSQNIEMQTRIGFGPMGMFLKPLTDMRDKGVVGIVFEDGVDYLIVQTPHGLRNIGIKDVEDIPDINKGDFIIAVGNRDGFNFKVEQIKIVDKKDMPAIDRGIDFKFDKELDEKNIKDIPLNMMFFNEQEQSCVKNCFNDNKNPKDCFKECHK
ncbi:MAG: hypothetical protein PHD31_01560 [Candidatus Pacebacteria bacterium]|nr:hypothetical protein [Candidatus Paceibacterota bacterium]